MNVNQYLDHCSEQNWQVPNNPGIKSPTKSGGEGEELKNMDDTDQPVLEARVKSLKQTISLLKTELLEEKALWKKEVELMASIISNERSPDVNSDVNSEAETDVKSVVSLPVTYNIASSNLIRDFEEKLNRYQGALAQAHAEKQLNIRRQIAANTYRKRLTEVEKLCQEELNKVRETATYLEPLKQMASEWNKGRESTYYVEPASPRSSPGMILEQSKGVLQKTRRSTCSTVECGGDFLPVKTREHCTMDEPNFPYEVPVKQIDASLVVDEDASNEIKGKIVLQIGSLPSEVPTICYSAKFE